MSPNSVPQRTPPVVPGPVAESPAPGGSSAYAGLGDLAELKNGNHMGPYRDHADKQADRGDGSGFLDNSADHLLGSKKVWLDKNV
jgi:hypothetical protein